MKEDCIKVRILEDGTIRSETDQISAPNHSGAEALFRLIDEITGSKGIRTKRKDVKVHVHEHGPEVHG